MIAQKKRIDNGIQEGRKWTLGNTKASKDMSVTNSDKAINMEFYKERERKREGEANTPGSPIRSL